MHQINVTEFRQHLPKFLKRVSQGEELQITSRGKVIARLVPEPDEVDAAIQRLKRLQGAIINSSVTSSIRFDVTIQALNSFFRCVTSTNGRKSYHPLIALRFKIAHWCS